MQTINVNALRSLLHADHADDAVVIDVRTPSEYKGERILGTTNIPLDQVDRYLDKLRGYKHVYVHCASGNRSSQACAKLAQTGLDNIINVEGGISAWKDAGFSTIVDSANKRLPVDQQTQVAIGSFVLAGVLLGTLVNPWFIALSALMGGGLIFAGLSGTCTLALLIARMPWNRA